MQNKPSYHFYLKYGNLLLAFSNLYGIIGCVNAFNKQQYLDMGIIFFAMSASFFFHLSERKHQLPGILPFSNYTWKLLWLDRIGAVLAFLRFLPRSFSNPFVFGQGLLGIIMMGVSESIPNPSFTPYHLLWHILAFKSLTDLV